MESSLSLSGCQAILNECPISEINLCCFFPDSAGIFLRGTGNFKIISGKRSGRDFRGRVCRTHERSRGEHSGAATAKRRLWRRFVPVRLPKTLGETFKLSSSFLRISRRERELSLYLSLLPRVIGGLVWLVSTINTRRPRRRDC